MWNKGRQNDIVRRQVLNHPWGSAGLWVAKGVTAMVCVHVYRRGQHQMSSSVVCHLLFESESTVDLRVYLFSWVDRPANPRGSPTSSPQHQDYSLVLLFPKMGFWKIWRQALTLESSSFSHTWPKSWLTEAFNLGKLSEPNTIGYIPSVHILNILLYFILREKS